MSLQTSTANLSDSSKKLRLHNSTHRLYHLLPHEKHDYTQATLPAQLNDRHAQTNILHWSQGSLSGQAAALQAATGTCLVPPSASSPTSLVVTIGAPPFALRRAARVRHGRGERPD